jgi:mycothiol synthase
VKGPVQAWLRGATEDDLAAAGRAGFALSKRLHVMHVPLTTPLVDSPDAAPHDSVSPETELPDGLRVRSFDAASSEDADAVVALLAAAYPGSEGGWDAAGFAVRRATDWFRAEDLLLLEDVGDVGDVEGVAGDGGEGGPVATAPRLLGVHWTKRRGEGVGEVHNLALGPAARGRGLGGLLLDAGLAHLAQAGCREVILWVDADNAPALRLYRSRGFVPRWDDVALVG